MMFAPRSKYHDPELFKEDMEWSAFFLVLWLIYWYLTARTGLISVDTLKAKGKKMTEEQVADVKNRFFSGLHSHVMVVLSFHFWLTNKAECGTLNTVSQRRIMVASMTYFVGDLIAMAADNLLD